MTDLQFRRLFPYAIEYLVMNRLMHIETRSRGANLSLIEKNCARDRRDNLFKIGIKQHYHRRLPTKLKSDSLQIRSCRLRNEPSHARIAGESDFISITIP